MVGLYDDRDQLIGWTNENLDVVLTAGFLISVEELVPDILVAPYIVHKGTDMERIIAPKGGTRTNLAHARRIAALEKLKEERDAITYED